MNYIVKEFLDSKVIKNIRGIVASRLKEPKTLYISSLHGSSKSFLINGLLPDENQLIVLLPDSKAVDELKVELTILGLSGNLLVINEFRPEPLQEILTEITKRKIFILLSTYNILNCELPSKERVNEQMTHIQVGGNLAYSDIIEYLKDKQGKKK